MSKFGQLLKNARQEAKMASQHLAQTIGIDISLLSKYEKGDRLPPKSQLEQLAHHLNIPLKTLTIEWLSEKIYKTIEDEEFGYDALVVAESKVGYRTTFSGNQQLLAQIDVLKKELDGYRPINTGQLRNLMDYYKVEYTYDSNRIEGNTLTLQETALVIEQGITISGKTVREHLEAINHAEAVEVLLEMVQQQQVISEYVIKQLHALVLRGIDKDNAGRYRSVNVRISGSKHLPPEPFMLNKLMEDLIFFYHEAKGRLHPVVLAAEMHERLVTIHPFIDGNGRTSRLLMNLVLMQFGYPITNINSERENRLDYYNALENSRNVGGKQHFYDFVAHAVLQSLEGFLKMVRPSSNS